MSLAQRAAALPPPAHVAIIMDGNGRWARARSLPRIAGHKSGAEAVRRIVRGAAELGIGFLTLYLKPISLGDVRDTLLIVILSPINNLSQSGL